MDSFRASSRYLPENSCKDFSLHSLLKLPSGIHPDIPKGITLGIFFFRVLLSQLPQEFLQDYFKSSCRDVFQHFSFNFSRIPPGIPSDISSEMCLKIVEIPTAFFSGNTPKILSGVSSVIFTGNLSGYFPGIPWLSWRIRYGIPPGNSSRVSHEILSKIISEIPMIPSGVPLEIAFAFFFFVKQDSCR